jgi:hypothetical protein
MNKPIGIGHNRAQFDLVSEAIETLHVEAGNWLDGEAVETQGQADAVSRLLEEARRAKKDADEARKTEAKPFDDGKAAVQAKYKPLLTRADTIADACKKLIAPFLARQEAEKREAERKAREEADAKAEAARRAYQEARDTDLAAREEAERLIEDAKIAERIAAKAAKDRGAAKGGARAVTLRAHYEPEITDIREFGRYVWTEHPAEMRGLLDHLARKLILSGKRNLPGVTIHEEKRAV